MQNKKSVLMPFVQFAIPWAEDPAYAFVRMVEYPYEKKKERKEDGQSKRAGNGEEFGIPSIQWM